jgi:hypothetical protein
MLMYDVMTEEEAEQERFQLLKEGEYEAVIVKSEDKQSSSGNSMIDLTLLVYDEHGRAVSVRDFLVFTRSMMWKIIHCADSAGVLSEYSQGRMCSNALINKNVRVKIGIEEGKVIPEDRLQGKDSGSKYPSKNKVLDYVKKSEQRPLNQKKEEVDEDVPF